MKPTFPSQDALIPSVRTGAAGRVLLGVSGLAVAALSIGYLLTAAVKGSFNRTFDRSLGQAFAEDVCWL